MPPVPCRGLKQPPVGADSTSSKVRAKSGTLVDRVVNGMDPHEWSVTIEMVAADEAAVDLRFSTDVDVSSDAAVSPNSGRRERERSKDLRPQTGIRRSLAHAKP
jgi:hypothetical protein